MSKMFRTQFDPHPRKITSSGNFEKVNYTGRYDDRGRVILTETGKTNMYEFIQSHADSVDINILLAKYKNGDAEALTRIQGVYADISDMPKTMADMLNKLMSAEDSFNSLDVETRALFDHSLSQFLATAGTPEWCEKMGLEYVAPEPKKKGTKKKVASVSKTESEHVDSAESVPGGNE